MKKRILPVLLACALAMQSGVWALAEELIAADEGVFYELEEYSGEIAGEAAVCNSSDECFESLQEETAEADECVMLEEEPESQGESAEFEALDGVSEQAEELQIPDEIVIEDIVAVDTAEYASASVKTQGSCGADMTWKLYSDYSLVISGSGEMYDYTSISGGNPAPWASYINWEPTIPTVTIEEGVTSIGTRAFQDLQIESVILPDSLLEVGDHAFDCVKKLSAVTLPERLQRIGDYAFTGCTALKSVNVPASVTYLGNHAFYYCTGMTDIQMPSKLNVASIPEGFLKDCWSLTSVTIPEGVTTIADYSFYGCQALTKINIPNTVQTIGSGKGSVLNLCYSLTDITIPASVTSIGNYAFQYTDSYDTSSSQNIVIRFLGNLPEIGSETFDGVKGTLYYLAGAEGWEDFGEEAAIGGGTFSVKTFGSGACGDNITWSLNSSGLLTISGSGAMEDYSDSGTAVPWDSLKDNIREVLISTDTEGSGVTRIGANAFCECKNLQTVTIADSVKSIGDGAFDGCSALKEISLPDTVESIGAWCFYQCNALECVTLPDGLTVIDDYAFYECEKLTSAEIPASVSSIGNFAFYGCKSLQQVTMEETSKLTAIGDYAFSCTEISAFEMPDTVKTLGLGAFWSDTNLEEITLSSSLTAIAGWTFELCPIKEIRIPASVTEIRTGAFLNCTQLKQIYFEGNQPTVDLTNANPQNPPFDGVTATVQYPLGGAGWSDGIPANWGGTLTMAAYGAAEGTCGANLTWMLGADGTLKISGAGSMYDYAVDERAPWSEHGIEITKVIIGDEVTSIGAYAFYNYHSLTSVALGGQVKEIGSAAFLDCGSLREVEFPSAVTAIGDAAFRMTDLKEIVFRGNLPTVGTYAFGVNPALAAEKIRVEYPDDNSTWVNLTNNTLGGIPAEEDVYQFVFVMHGHTWEYTGVKQAATCTATGLNGYICHDCGRTKTETISMIAHSWDSGRITTAPKCKTSGIRTYTCTSCKGTKTETVAATGHSAGAWTVAQASSCAIDGTEVRKCKNCDLWLEYRALDAIGHSWGKWTVASNATVFAPKKEQSTCSTCGYVGTRTVGSALSPLLMLNTDTLPIQTGKSTSAVKARVLRAGDYVVSWESSNTSIVTVNSETGKITAKKKTGTATITATTAAGATDTIKVTVQKKAVKSQYISMVGDKKHTVAKGKKLNLVKTMQITVYPLTTSEKLTFTSSNKKVATVSSAGVVTAKSVGTAKITMKSGKTKVVATIVVPKTKTTKITGVKAKLSLKKGKTYTLKAKLTPKNSDEKITYKTSNKKIATVSSKGKITAKKKGTATITVKSGSVSVKCKVTVK